MPPSPRPILPALLLTALGCIAYALSFNAPLIFDDLPAIRDNPHLRQLWPLWIPLTAPPESPLGARPVVSLSMAVNHALHELSPVGFHVVNLALHLLSGLLLLDILRRTFRSPILAPTLGHIGPTLAAAIACLWVVHPLNSEAVVYILQRTELMVSFFLLLTLACAIRRFDAPHGWPWTPLAILACALGMGSKEVMVGTPLLVLFYDRTFHSAGFLPALRSRRGLYAGLASTWILLALLVLSEPRKDSAGFHHAMTALDYLRTQAGAILWYIRLVFWPHPLSIIHPWPTVRSWGPALLPGAAVLALLAAAAVGLWRRRAWAFPAAAFFVILAPTSSVVPIVTEVAAERRMYLPSAAILTLALTSLASLLFRRRDAAEPTPQPAPAMGDAASGTSSAAPAAPDAGDARRRLLLALIVTPLVLLAAGLTFRRVLDYRSAPHIWLNAAAQYPRSPDALNNLGFALGEAGRDVEAIEQYKLALAIEPGYQRARINLGNCYYRLDRFAEAQPHYEAAVEADPKSVEARFRLAQNLESLARPGDAIAQYRTLIAQDPAHLAAQTNLGLLLQRAGRLLDALPHLQQAVALKPDDADSQANLAAVMVELGRSRDALPHFEAALGLRPTHFGAQLGLGKALLDQGQLDRAEKHLREASRLNAASPAPSEFLGALLARQSRTAEAIEQFAIAADLQPKNPAARGNLAAALTQGGRLADAAEQYAAAAQLDPQNPSRQVALGQALARLGRAEESQSRLRRAVELDPRSPEARLALGESLAEQRRTPDAIAHLREAVKLRPRWPQAMSALAWCLATRSACTRAEAAEALTLAQGAVDLTGGRHPRPLDALGVAAAQAGQFDKALAAGQRALERAVAGGLHAQAQEIQGRLGLYLAKKPFVESPAPAVAPATVPGSPPASPRSNTKTP